MKKRIAIPALVVGTLLSGSLVLAGPGGYGRGDCGNYGFGHAEMTTERHEERVERKLAMMSTVLELTDAQKSQIETLFNQQHEKNLALREQMQASREEMREAKHASTFDEADFRAKAARRAELKTEMMVQKAKLRQQVYELLSPEQQEKADSLGGMLGRGHGKGRHGGRGYGF